MEIELVKCECCGLFEDCTQDYISQIKSKFQGKWLCGLCSEAVRDEVKRADRNNNNNNNNKQLFEVDEAIKAHMSFCRKYKSNNPATRVADGMMQMLRRRMSRESSSSSSSSSSSTSSSKKYSISQVGDDSRFSCY